MRKWACAHTARACISHPQLPVETPSSVMTDHMHVLSDTNRGHSIDRPETTWEPCLDPAASLHSCLHSHSPGRCEWRVLRSRSAACATEQVPHVECASSAALVGQGPHLSAAPSTALTPSRGGVGSEVQRAALGSAVGRVSPSVQKTPALTAVRCERWRLRDPTTRRLPSACVVCCGAESSQSMPRKSPQSSASRYALLVPPPPPPVPPLPPSSSLPIEVGAVGVQLQAACCCSNPSSCWRRDAPTAVPRQVQVVSYNL